MKSNRIIIFLSILIFAACASKVLNYDKVGPLKKIDEFEDKVQIVTQGEPDALLSAPRTTVTSSVPVISLEKEKAPEPQKVVQSEKVGEKKKTKKTKKTKTEPPPIIVETRHEPADIEGQNGFIGRRPIKDPFKVGERVKHDVSYLGMTAGSLMMETKPYAEVNGKKSYQFQTSIETRSLFASIYAVDDKSISLLDFETLIPSVFTLHVRESKQLKEARAFFDRKKGLATYWEKKVTADEGEKEKKLEWEIADYSQNVFSSFYYLRTFPWEVGMENAFRVADDGKNLVFRAKAIRKEKIKTDAGEFNTIVIKPEVELRGIAQAMGDIYMWLTDDDRKFLVRLEAKIKIGYLTSEAVELDVGHD